MKTVFLGKPPFCANPCVKNCKYLVAFPRIGKQNKQNRFPTPLLPGSVLDPEAWDPRKSLSRSKIKPLGPWKEGEGNSPPDHDHHHNLNDTVQSTSRCHCDRHNNVLPFLLLIIIIIIIIIMILLQGWGKWYTSGMGYPMFRRLCLISSFGQNPQFEASFNGHVPSDMISMGSYKWETTLDTGAMTADEAATSWMQRISIRLLNKSNVWILSG